MLAFLGNKEGNAAQAQLHLGLDLIQQKISFFCNFHLWDTASNSYLLTLTLSLDYDEASDWVAVEFWMTKTPKSCTYLIIVTDATDAVSVNFY